MNRPQRTPPKRQLRALDDLAARIAQISSIEGLILVGSLAAGTADALSDVDTIAVTTVTGFATAWAGRHRLHADPVCTCWDVTDPHHPDVGAHKWIDTDGVLVECLLTAPDSGVRLARPAQVITGGPSMITRLPVRDPIVRTEMSGGHPVEDAYNAFKNAVRGFAANFRGHGIDH